MADNNVFILFEEIKTALKGINGKLKELIGMVNQQPKNGDVEQDFSPIKDAIVETTKAQSEVIKGLLAKQWKAYAQISTLILQQLDTIKRSQSGQNTQQEPQPQEYIHKHSFEIKSNKVFSFVVGLGMVCALSLWGNVAQWQSNRQYADDALKFRAIRSWGGCNANDVLWLNKVFDLHRDKKAIEWIRKQANGYETSLKTVSDSLMQESLKKKQNSKSD